MTAYYNENDEFAADWLRNLIAAGLIANGEVDTRSIADVRPGDLTGFTQCHFFAGIGGWSYALRKAGWDDSRPAWTGSCPCQPFSLAGAQKGFADPRHLWPIWRELIRECAPPVVFGEQVASATEWLGLVRGDLEAMEYAVGAMPIQAASAGADHLRDRYWFVADDGPGRCSGPSRRQGEQPRRAETVSTSHPSIVADADDARSQGRRLLPERAGQRPAGSDGVANDMAEPDFSDQRGHAGSARVETGPGGGEAWQADGDAAHSSCPSGLDWVIGADGKARRVKSGIRLLAHGVPNRVGLLRGFGNAIDHRPAKEFIAAYMSARASYSIPSHECKSEAQ